MTKVTSAATPEYLTEETEVETDKYEYFLGIDPSYSSTGFVLLDKASNEPVIARTIKAGNPREKFFDRIKKLLDTIDDTMVQYDIEKIHVVMEGAAFASEFGAFKLGKLSGVLEFYLASNGYNYHLVAPTFVKKVAAGNGAANKIQVMRGVGKRWGFHSTSNDICDAYAMAQIAKGEKPLEKEKANGRKNKRT